uniref:Uncharacterized protein n=1 Tax=Fundulus heteroclitus TaxID=8078 RepID=A0A3Q2R2Z2_FUNHE
MITSIHIVALGSECPGGVGPGEEPMGQGQLQGGLLWSYLGQGATVGPCDLEGSLHNPAFMEYTSRVFGDVAVVVRDCPSWVRLHRTGRCCRQGMIYQMLWLPAVRPSSFCLALSLSLSLSSFSAVFL